MIHLIAGNVECGAHGVCIMINTQEMISSEECVIYTKRDGLQAVS